MHHAHKLEVEISADAFVSFVRLAAAVSLLALYKIGRGSGWPRSRQRARRGHAVSRVDAVSPRGSAPAPGPAWQPKRNRLTLHALVAGMWIVLSLLLLAYATIEGEFAVADLDGFDLLATYAWSPP